jgi:hypothetical protein
MQENTYSIRTFMKGDEVPIVQLFNSTFKEYAGFVPRTPQYWNWCCLQRPDVTEEGITIVSQQEKIVGYAVAGKSGNIWEMCYDQTCDKESVVTKILTRTLDYLESIEAESVLLNFPTNDEVVRKICKKFNFAEGPPEYMFISVLDFPRLISEVLKKNLEKEKVNGHFLFRLKNLPPSFSNNFCVDIRSSNVTITEKAAIKPEIVLDADAATLISCMLGGENILKAIATSRIRFYPFWKIGKVRKLFSLLQNSSPWFMPRADSG